MSQGEKFAEERERKEDGDNGSRGERPTVAVARERMTSRAFPRSSGADTTTQIVGYRPTDMRCNAVGHSAFFDDAR